MLQEQQEALWLLKQVREEMAGEREQGMSEKYLGPDGLGNFRSIFRGSQNATSYDSDTDYHEVWLR